MTPVCWKVSDSRRINFGEFVELFEALKESTLSRSKANSTSIKRGRLSRRAALCAERIVFFARRGTTKDLEIGQNQRKTPPEASTLSKHGCFTTNKSLTQAQRLIQVAPGKANLMEIDAPMPTKSLSEQLGAFQVACPFQHTGLAVVLQGLVRPRLRGTELEFWRNSEEARTDRPSQQLRSLNGEWRLMRYFLLTHLCGISHRIWCTLSTICSDAA